MHGGELPVHGHSKHLRHQVRPQQVRDGLVVLKVGRTNPDLGQQPVVLAVGGQEDGAVLAGGLFELEGRVRVRRGEGPLSTGCSGGELHLYGDGQDLILRVLVEEAHGSGQVLQRAWICVVGFDAIQHFVVHHVDVASLEEERIVRVQQVGESRCHQREQKAAVFKVCQVLEAAVLKVSPFVFGGLCLCTETVQKSKKETLHYSTQSGFPNVQDVLLMYFYQRKLVSPGQSQVHGYNLFVFVLHQLKGLICTEI